MGAPGQSSLRALAPASLVLFAIAFLVVIVASLGGGDSSSSSADRATSAKTEKRPSQRKRKPRILRTSTGARYYVVRAGDNLSTIANRTGVPVGTILELNPSLDPQALSTGQRIRLPGSDGGASGASGATGATGATGPSGAAGRGVTGRGTTG
jgi:LysM repeat protein